MSFLSRCETPPDVNDPTTCTVMAHHSMKIDLLRFFWETQFDRVPIPKTSKVKNVDKKRLSAPIGTIFNIRKGTLLKGPNMSKSKKYWCPICRLRTERGSEIHTVNEFLDMRDNRIDLKKFRFTCSECGVNFNLKDLKKDTTFRNQVTVNLSIGEGRNPNIMMFKGSFKITGCKNIHEAITCIEVIWGKIRDIPGMWTQEVGDPCFILDLVMKNVIFKIGLDIDRQKLKQLFLDEKKTNKDIVKVDGRRSENSEIAVKVKTNIPDRHQYTRITFPGDVFIPTEDDVDKSVPEYYSDYHKVGTVDGLGLIKSVRKINGKIIITRIPTNLPNTIVNVHPKFTPREHQDPVIDTIGENMYNKNPKKPIKPCTIRFFSSSKVVISARFDEDILEKCQMVCRTIFTNQDKIVTVLKRVDMIKMASLLDSYKEEDENYSNESPL